MTPKVTLSKSINPSRNSGQTVFYVHLHLIPIRDGDVVDPRGGVRGVIQSKQKYETWVAGHLKKIQALSFAFQNSIVNLNLNLPSK